ncbi:Protein of unknown function, partial [Gryllus bimaculatus]
VDEKARPVTRAGRGQQQQQQSGAATSGDEARDRTQKLMPVVKRQINCLQIQGTQLRCSELTVNLDVQTIIDGHKFVKLKNISAYENFYKSIFQMSQIIVLNFFKFNLFSLLKSCVYWIYEFTH